MKTKERLKTLISYPTVSSDSNLDLIQYVEKVLGQYGIETHIVYNEHKTKAALYAAIGPTVQPGIVLSGHTDVVPVAGQNWTEDPFKASEKDGLLYGRGSCDMKGFIASAINTMIAFSDKPLTRPVHLALSFDEELGCLGVRDLLVQLKQIGVEPYLCIVGEPTSMNIATGHKGKTAYRTHCCGDEGHSSQAPLHTNAIYLACDVISSLRQLQSKLIESGAHDEEYNIPYSTVHIGTINGGRALNIVPGECTFEFEIRHLAQDNIANEIETIVHQAKALIDSIKIERSDSKAAIHFECLTDYPGLNTDKNTPAVKQLYSLSSPETKQIKVAFGTEGGLFSEYLSAPVVVCGPGSIDQAHKPDEFVSLQQLDQCDELLSQFIYETCYQRSEHD
ncbi:acetylornithine deacetylase [Vibrio viridaestus]|uniref:Acetylornithine deacetylase n=1 Tax=Vibrio viridaestus TaxID=2487322 RepID=A0A3N9TCT6_9VIBR|nr:acetylornithine deacetylase [Vibrio viridaestus]RQW61879.1 acetylornithine deacetylase [Vibrio viridaestus]